MNWEIVLFKSEKKIDQLENLEESALETTGFCSILEKHFKDFEVNEGKVLIRGEDFTIRYVADGHPTNHKILWIDHESALFQLVELAKFHHWQIFDVELGEMIDLWQPARNGFKNLKNFQQQVIKKEIQ